MPRTPEPQPVNLSGMDKPSLHPERIRAALVYLRGESESARVLRSSVPELVESCVAALELIRKSQLAVGLTGQVVDAGRVTMDLWEALKRIGK